MNARLLAFCLSILTLPAVCGCPRREISRPPGVSPPQEAASPPEAAPSRPEAPRPIVVAMVPKSLDNPVFLDAKEAAEETARRLGVVLEWVAPFNTDAGGQIEVMEALIRRRVDGIAISCNDPDRLRDLIDKAVSAGIKVATFDADCPGSKRLFYCGTDNFRAGWACGEALMKILRRRGLEKKRLRAAILTGGINAHNLNERIRGFCACVSGRLNLEYLETMACDDDTIKGAELIEAFLRRHPENEVFFFAGTWPLFAPAESMPLYQKWCQRGGITVAIDTFYPVLQAAKQGLAQALVGQDFRKMGELTVSRLVAAIKGQPVPAEYIYTDLEMADSSNFDRLLATKKPWEMK